MRKGNQMAKTPMCVKKSYSIPEGMAAWIEKIARIRAGKTARPNESRVLVSLLRPAYEARHSDRKRETA